MSQLSKGKILVTGGAGFVGSALIHALNERGADEIYVTDRLGREEKWRNLRPLRFSDYIDADELRARLTANENELGEVTTVFHLGACSSTTETDVTWLTENNFEYTKFLAHWALRNAARFIYASSAATYGDGSRGMDDKSPELHRLRPLNPYGYSKQMFDLYAQRTGILPRIVGLKYFNIFGPNENHKGEMRSVVHKAFEQVSTSGKVDLFKSEHPDYRDGEQKRDFLYIRDAVAMTLHLSSTETAGGLYNIGSNVASTWIELVTPIFKALDKPVRIEFVETPPSIRSRYQYFTRADISKLRSTGYPQPPTSLETAVTETVRDYLIPDKRLGE